MNIKINNQEFRLKKTIRTYFIFENLTGRQFDNSKVMDVYLLFYSMLLANNPEEFNLTFDDFINICDEDETIFQQFNEYITNQINIDNQFTQPETGKKKAKTKK
ncbi:hypothetical protein LJC54_00160 [Parabacteroides sp. OttesenSCG-928-J18]|nr:hypothetical protein [Parabacteroides sp. OttesenSCG-928-J18]